MDGNQGSMQGTEVVSKDTSQLFCRDTIFGFYQELSEGGVRTE